MSLPHRGDQDSKPTRHQNPGAFHNPHKPRPVFRDTTYRSGNAQCRGIGTQAGKITLHGIPLTSSQGPGVAGSVFGDVVYHNFYSTQGRPDLMAASEAMWQQAVATYL